ncbi:hypothetical protein K466DRAFT_288919 [Polyporus arcularius HHB13444]|uniref:Uncharacterized protein n=1 Tax=Polyporus arcularius HHB13444 TaxID=1314778 RepID=A0A5C3NZ60_9APHY|nr:hypothetical protein K466DRAFT_288919 [Polyporus arcularius HHB13444]
MFTKLALLSALALAGLASLVVASPIRLPVPAPTIASDSSLAPRGHHHHIGPHHHHHHHHHHPADADGLASTIDDVAGDVVEPALGELASLPAAPLVPREHQDRAPGTLKSRCFFLARFLGSRRGRRPGLPAGPPANGTSPVSSPLPAPSSPAMPSIRLPMLGNIEKRDSHSEGAGAEPAESDAEVLSSSEPAEECDCCKDKTVLEGSLSGGDLISGLSGEGDIGLDSDMVPDVPQSDI